MNISAVTAPARFYAPTTTTRPAAPEVPKNGGGKNGQLSQEEQALVGKLKAVDQKVRQHEQAHLAAAGGLATSGSSFTYQKGPDGVNYAVGGEVGIDTSPGKTPEETLSRAQTIRAAALAPADPSGADRAIAAQADQMAQQAQSELSQQQRDGGQSAETPSGERQAEIARFYGAVSASTPGISTYA